MQPSGQQRGKLKRALPEEGDPMEGASGPSSMDVDLSPQLTAVHGAPGSIPALQGLFSLISAAKGANDPAKMSDRLQSLAAEYYPHYAGIAYEKVEMPSDHGTRYRCKLVIFDMVLESREVHEQWEDAKEAAAKLGYELLKEFNATIQMRANDARFERLFKPLIDEIVSGLAPIKADPAEEAKKALGLPAILSVDRYKQTDSLPQQKSVLSPLLSAIFTKMNAPGTLPKAEEKPADVAGPAPKKPGIAKEAPSPAEPADPVMILQEHYQKMSATAAPPAYEFFERTREKRLLFGCKASYQGADYIVEASYATKREAKKAVAGQVCAALFGKTLEVAEVADAVPSASSSARPKDFVYANSNKILDSPVVPATTYTSPDGGASLTVLQQANPSKLAPASERSKLDPLPDGRKYVSVVNEFCQFLKVAQPAYQFQTGDSITTFYVAHADTPFTPASIDRIGRADGDDGPKKFVGVACTKKNDAKEDCAMRIFEFMLKQRWVDATGKRVVGNSNPAAESKGKRPYHNPAGDSRRPSPSPRYYSSSLPPAAPYPVPQHPHQQHQHQNFMSTSPAQFMPTPPGAAIPPPFFPPPFPMFNPNAPPGGSNPSMPMSAPPFMPIPPFPFPPRFTPPASGQPQHPFPQQISPTPPQFPLPPLPGQSLANPNALLTDMRKNADPRLKKQQQDHHTDS
jgi:hypothetical protein